MKYLTSDLFEVIEDIEFDEDPDETEGEGEATLRALYNLPNIKQDESALLVVIEYAESKEGDELTLEQVEQYAKLFVQFYDNWTAYADEWLNEKFGSEIRVIQNFLDADGFGKWVGKDQGGYFEVSDGRVACFNKKEGE